MGWWTNRAIFSEGDVKVRNKTHVDIKSKYNIKDKILGHGKYGNIYEGYLIASPHTEVAIKAVNKVQIKNDLNEVDSNVNILQKLDHPNIVKYYETFENNRYYFIVMELWKGGDLFDIMKLKSESDKNFSEAQASSIIYDILKALNYCHNRNVNHLDIRPENILIGSNGELKLIDFRTTGSENIHESNQTKHWCPCYYSAPELIDGKGQNKSDIWALGIILYILLSGLLPFEFDKDVNKLITRIKKADFNFDEEPWKIISDSAKELISNMIWVDIEKRYSASQWLSDKFFTNVKNRSNPKLATSFGKDLIQTLTHFKSTSKLKLATLNIIAKRANSEKINDLKVAFEELDENNSGEIDAENLMHALEKSGMNITKEESQRIISQIDFHNNQKITYTEFIAAAISSKLDIYDDPSSYDREILESIFNEFDVTHNGNISRSDLEFSFKKLGFTLSKAEIDEIMKNHDLDVDGKISFDEFVSMMEHQNIHETTELDENDESTGRVRDKVII